VPLPAQLWVIFLAYALSLPIYVVHRLATLPREKRGRMLETKLYFFIFIPAIIALISSFLLNVRSSVYDFVSLRDRSSQVGLLWVMPSLLQMLRGSVILFTAILKVTYRKHPLLSHG